MAGAKEDTMRGREGKHIQSSVEIMFQFLSPQFATVVKDLGGNSVLLLTSHMAPGTSVRLPPVQGDKMYQYKESVQPSGWHVGGPCFLAF